MRSDHNVCSGAQTFRALREMNPEVKVLIASGLSDSLLETQLKGEGLAGFIQKPFTREQLLTQLRAICSAPI